MNETPSNTFVIPKVWATYPFKDMINATIPQENPFINPPIILLYSGIMLWAIFIVTGTASIVTKPIIKYTAKEKKLDTEKKIVIVSSLNKDEKIVSQVEVILNILGISVEFYSVSPYKTVSMQILKNYIHTANAVIVIYDKDIRLPSIVSNISPKPVVILSKNNNAEEYMLSNGAVLAKSGSSISACMAVARLLR